MSQATAVSDERAEELRAGWKATTATWLEKVDDRTAEEWAFTFAPDHPEWFTAAAIGESA